jgi:hypothetical protein
LRRTKIEEELRRAGCRHVEYSIVGYKVVVAFIIFKMCRREGI